MKNKKNKISIEDLTDDTFKPRVRVATLALPVVVYFKSEECPMCEDLTSVYESLASDFAHKFSFFKVDIDEENALKEQYSDEGVPTMIVFPFLDINLRRYEEIPWDGEYSHDYIKTYLNNFTKEKNERIHT